MCVEKEKLDEIRHLIALRDIEVGKVIDDRLYDALMFCFGDLITKVKAVKETSVTIHFDSLGQAHSIDNNGMIESVNGKKL